MSGYTAAAIVLAVAAFLIYLPSRVDRIHRQNRIGQSRVDRLADPTPLPGEEWVQ